MCGIAGIISPRQQADRSVRDQRDILAMTEQLVHRGPDGSGFWHNDACTVRFGHRRLAVIDTSPAAAQPMHYAQRFTIVYNGELYNYRELKSELQRLGHRFQTESDTEVILAAFAQYKEECLQRFDGMFALAIWDELEQRLFMARDRFGEKPFFFHEDDNGRFLFASEMKALWALGVTRQMDANHSLLFLATGQTGFPLAPERTSYTTIFQLPAASYMWLKLERDTYSPGKNIRYWDINTRQEYAGTTMQAAAELKERLLLSVQMRLRSDVPVGTSLSGGIDSGTIAALVHQLKGLKFQAFSAVFPGFEKDESALIQTLCQQFALESRQTVPGAGDLLADFDRLLWHQEEPIGSASVLVQYKVFELAKAFGVTVLLDGQGADEILGGYTQYIPWFLQEKWRSGQWKSYRKELEIFRRHGQQFKWGLKNYGAALFPHAAQSQLISRQAGSISRLPMVNPEFAAAFDARELLYKPLVTDLNDLLYFDTTMGKLPELLRYADRNSMAHGREVRLPFLQHSLVQWLFSLPANYKMKDGYTKWILRKSMENILPQTICWQSRKIAFEPPQYQWMQEAAVRERIRASREKLVQQGILHKKILSTAVSAAPAHAKENYDWRYWVLASLQ
ncbi:asparagine synthase (glutamine-hydrolyzing) [Flavihumibacter fluvii]|uniref:asparagine synthase (glutamine-hydrolyzing) n=1 Tax=Flavihumibacter fluvii TaxID=2838157 RepID=UPI001BDE4D7A|nr:asparagine synthase (glutamine-hydrolyzing) [Flavihumibacter fluvii]ULQ51855.1 asparagine synthase (glutamine-hydrolyzing) [Flavihumibacter fluvii]